MAEQPTGTVTLLFTDIEGSTGLLERLGRDRYAESLDLHRGVLRKAFETHGGYEVDYEGDAFFVAFARAEDAVAAASEAQQELAAAQWPEGQEFRVRIGIHTGEPLPMPPKYVGLDVHKAARIMAAGHGGQVLLSDATRRLVNAADTVSLGEHRLKDLLQPEPLCQLLIDGLPSEFPALKTLGNRPTNLPVQPNPLIGREREIEAVTALVRDGEVRLVTLTGTGGTGKTRLALQVGAELLEDFSSGVFFVSLAPVRDRRLVTSAVAEALAVREVAGEPVRDTLARYLEQKHMLLVLDNFEQVIDAASEVAALLSRCPKLKLLVTSRERLRVGGEYVCQVPPLTLPEANGGFDGLRANDAVALFAARAQGATGAFVLDEENAPVVAAICARLDGLPLAIELAAARVAVLTPQALLRRLDQRLPLLTGGTRDSHERQRTLRNTIEWSYELLSPVEQTLFARLSVFVDGCRLDTADAVCDPEGDLGLDILDGITSLLDKNLLRHRAEPDREPRYWLLETVREYAGERLVAAGQRDQLRSRHADCFFALVNDVFGANLTISQEVERVAREQANITAALVWAEEQQRGAQLAAAVADLFRLWLHRSQLQEGMHWADAALAYRATLDAEVLVPLLAGASMLFRFANDNERAKALMHECLLVNEQSGNRVRVRHGEVAAAHTLADLADIAIDEGSLEEARNYLERSLALGGGARTLAALGLLALALGELAEARSYYEQALGGFKAAGHDYNHAATLNALAEVARRSGDTHRAFAHLTDSLHAFEALGDEAATAECLMDFAALAADQGDLPRAGRLVGAATRYRNQSMPPSLPEEVRATLPQDAIEAGQTMTLAGAARYAISVDEREPARHAPIGEESVDLGAK